MKVKIYIEGGGNDNASLKAKCRRGFTIFFKNSGLTGKMPSVVACGSRNEAYHDFCIAVKNAKDGIMPMLLVDSEAPVVQGDINFPWTHLKTRDQWDRPAGVEEDQAHLMVQCMESWFVADKETLKAYFGVEFSENYLPRQVVVETIAKGQLEIGLKKATRPTQKGEYGKGAHSFEILENLNPEIVQTASPWAKRLIDTLKEKL